MADVIVAAGPGGGPRVRILDGTTFEPIASPIGDFFAYEQTFDGGVSIAIADINTDGQLDLLTAAGPGGGPRVRAFSGITGDTLLDFFAYSPDYLGGVTLAAGDLLPDGSPEIVVATRTELGYVDNQNTEGQVGPRVKIFHADGSAISGDFSDFLAFETIGGARIELADINADQVRKDTVYNQEKP